MGLRWMPSWPQVAISRSSSKVPDAAGQGDEAVGQLGHQGLARVHRRDDAHVGDAAVGELPRREAVGDHADDAPARGEGLVGEDAHEADRAAPEHDADPARDEPAGEGPRRLGVARVAPRARAAEDADAAHGAAQRPFGNIAISRPKPAAAAQP